MKKSIAKVFFSLLIFASAATLFAQQAQISTEPHKGSVVVVHPCSQKDSYFSAGEDGFLTKWSSDNIGERYQITDLRITAVATSPNSQDVAVATTDGGSIHKVEVMDWATSSRKYTKQFKEPVVSISYSARGRYLFITTGEVQGNYVLNAANGKLIKKIDQISTRIGLVQTADSEKLAIFYCPANGQLLYYNLVKMELTNNKFQSETGLEQPHFFGAGEKSKNRFLAGIKNNILYIVDVMSGKTLYSATMKKPLIVDALDKSAVYFTTSDSAVHLNKITESNLLQKISSSSTIVSPVLVSDFPTVPANMLCSVGLRNELSAMFGTSDGEVFQAVKSETSYSTNKVTKDMFNKILDLASFEGNVFLLTLDGVYRTSYDDKEITLVGKNNGQTNFTIVDGTTVVLWSAKTKKSVQKLSLSAENPQSPSTLFTPVSNVLKLHTFERNLVYTLANSKVERFNIDTFKKVVVYSGNSVEDAIMLSSNSVYVAKAASSSIDSPLISKSISTGETAPLRVDGYVSFSIDADFNEDKNIYGITLKEMAGGTVTQVFQYFPSQRKAATLLRYNQEDQEAFVQLEGRVLYTNLGKHQVYAYDLESGKVRMYRRTSSLPKKIACTEDRIVFLNGDGGISWYNPLSQSPMAQWYLSLDGSWIEL